MTKQREGIEIDPIPLVIHQSEQIFHGEYAKIVDN
jgi:hypothetical protein